MANTANIVASTLAGLRSEALVTYKETYEGERALLAQAIVQYVPSTRNVEDYYYNDTPAYMKRQDRGDEAHFDSFRGVRFQIENHDWSAGVKFHANDVDDDQVRDALDQAAQIGKNSAYLDTDLALQFITSRADPDLLLSFPNGPDGAALYSASSRFGIATGNVVTGTGVTPQAIRTDAYTVAHSTFGAMQNTKGKQLWRPQVIRQGMMVVYGVANSRAADEAFGQKVSVRTQTVGATGTAASESNVFTDLGFPIVQWPTPLITDNSFYYFLIGSHRKPLIIQERDPLRSFQWTRDNSDEGRSRKLIGEHWEIRKGIGSALPISTVQVTNS